MMKKTILSLVTTVALTGCLGYEPLYKETSETLSQVTVGDIRMKEIEVDDGERRSAQLVAQRLRRTFHSESLENHILDVEISEDKTTLAVERDATETRLELNLTAYVVLKDAKGQTVFQTSVMKSAPFNVEDTPFSTDSGKERARSSVVQVIADEIVHRISFYFYNRQKG